MLIFYRDEARPVPDSLIKDSERLLRLALEGADHGTFYFDAGTQQVTWDARTRELFGALVTTDTFFVTDMLALVHPDDVHAVREAYARALDPKGSGSYDIEHRINTPDASVRWITVHGRTKFSKSGKPLFSHGVVRETTREKETDLHRELLIGELNHRVKNMLATVQAMASHTLRGSDNLEDFQTAFMGRLNAIAAAQSVLTTNDRSGARLRQVIARQVRPYAPMGDERLTITGPVVALSGPSAHAISLVLHELATNAAKHGAWKSETGAVEISWSFTDSACDHVEIIWQESGGPAVAEPTRRGFGTRLIQQSLGHSLGGSATIDYAPDGVCATLTLPMDAGYD